MAATEDDNGPKKTISARVNAKAADDLEDLGKADDRTMSYMVDRAIREYVDKHGKKPKEKK
jgi:predicted transcriptional regulator